MKKNQFKTLKVVLVVLLIIFSFIYGAVLNNKSTISKKEIVQSTVGKYPIVQKDIKLSNYDIDLSNKEIR